MIAEQWEGSNASLEAIRFDFREADKYIGAFLFSQEVA